MPCYLANALALAQRAAIPIHVGTEVFSGAEASPRAEDGRAVTRWLDGLRPADFS